MTTQPQKFCPICKATFEANRTFCPTDGALLEVPQAEELGVGDIIAGHRILKKLGEGGMGQVYLAEHLRMGRSVALKVMRPDVASEANAVSRFTREARNASQINHPNVATVYEFGEADGGALYISMEFIEGMPLSKMLHDRGSMPAPRAAVIIRQAADALKAAHDVGMVHRDLKPDNIMLARLSDGSDRVKLVDFGISKVVGAADQRVTTTGLTVGTPAYMSPEQVAGSSIDAASDQFSLACTAFEMVTGALPFEGETGLDQVASRLTGRARQLTQVRSDVPWPTDLQGVLERALSQKPAQRYESVVAFAEAFSRASASMSDVASAEIATQVFSSKDVLNAIPPTVVRGGAIAPTALDVPSLVTPAAPPMPAAHTPPAPARSGGSGRMVAIGGGAAVLVGALAFALLQKPAASPVTDASAVPIVNTPLAGSAQTPTVASATSGGVETMSKSVNGTVAQPNTQPNAPSTAQAPPSAAPTTAAPSSAAAAPTTAPIKRADPEPVKPARTDGFAGELARLETLAGAEGKDSLMDALKLSGRLLDRAGSARDSAAVLFEGGRALASMGRKAAACTTYSRAEKIAGALPVAQAIRGTAADLGC